MTVEMTDETTDQEKTGAKIAASTEMAVLSPVLVEMTASASQSQELDLLRMDTAITSV